MRTIQEIAYEINKDWGIKTSVHAKPYLDAMYTMDYSELEGNFYGCDRANSVVRYFLSNAITWRGENARRIKLELKKLL